MNKIIVDPNMPALESFEALGEVIKVPGREWTNELVRDADILLTRSVTKVNEQLLKNSQVRFVGTATSGFDHIDLAYLEDQAIHFTYCPGSNAVSVAEYVLSSLLCVLPTQQTLRGMTAGVIGCGQVGSRVIEKLETLGVECILNDPPLKERTGDMQYRSLDEALSADIVTLHTPLTYEGEHATFGLIKAEQFDLMKAGMVFINSARGSVVDEADLLRHMEQNPQMKTVIDCWEDEPHINHELLKSVDLGTPHIAGYSYDGKVKATRMLYESLCEFLAIKPNWSFVENSTHAQVNLELQRNEIECIRHAVLSSYDVRTDDRKMRALLNLNEHDSRAAFDALRKNYAERREFQQSLIKTDQFNDLFKKLGFSLAE